MRYILILLVSLLFNCSSSPSISDAEVKDLSPEKFSKKMAELDNELLLDVRTAEELISDGSIENAINYDFYGADFKTQITKLDTLVPVMVYCKSGGRSGKTAKMLQDLGFKTVYNLDGGMIEWNKYKEENK